MNNINALKKFIEKVENVKEEEYTEASWKPFEEVLKSSNEALNEADKNANREYINLVTAYLNLRLKPDKDLLKKGAD